MRRPLVVPLVLAGALALGSCSGNGPEGGGLPEVSSGFGEQPVLTFPESEAPEGLQVETLAEGDGAEVGEGEYIVADYIGQVWGAEAPFNDTWDIGYPIGFPLDGVIQGWSEGIPGSHVGDRLLLSIPSEMGYPQGNPQAGIEAGDTLVFVIDVLSVHPEGEWTSQADARDTGELANLPVTVEGPPGSPPSISVVEGSPEPEELSGTVVAEGDGETVGRRASSFSRGPRPDGMAPTAEAPGRPAFPRPCRSARADPSTPCPALRWVPA
ncbi:MAG TPA: FKBP-type peptidyl-prolyl cis-trans isomerase [Actinomycetaceae bacterium]|nr:FKBP-type peptidyl-prolyl cis-trans isomerase [Actinomycetaceae bacterium]